MFRLSATLDEPIDVPCLEQALKATLKRIPCFASRLRKGLFWYYFEHINGAPGLQEDVGNPLVRMDLRENGRFLFRVRYYRNRVAVEFFHALTDGNGGMSFLLTLVREYLRLRYQVDIPAQDNILDCADKPSAEESEDSFRKYARGAASSRSEAPAFHIHGEPESRNFLNITTGIIPNAAIRAKAKEYGVSVTALLTALLIDTFQGIQFSETVRRKRLRAVKVQVPVNLRKFYGSHTLRNFASYANIGVNSAYGRYTFEEILEATRHTMGLEFAEKSQNARMSGNVNTERNLLLRAMPLFIKAPFMRAGFLLQGDRYNTTTFSNLGEIRLPEAMRPYVKRLDFLLGVPSSNPVICACVSLGDSMYMNFSRKTRESDVERAFFTALVRMGVPVRVESNRR